MTQLSTAEHFATLAEFIDAIPSQRLSREIAATGTITQAEAERILAIYINETRVAMDLVAPLLRPGQRILEVGAGLCLFSLYLRTRGFDVTALEPASGGFESMALLKGKVLAHYQSLELPVLELTAEQLTSDVAGSFDLILSSNVMEHIPNYPAALQALTRCLAADGVMAHGCPNYLIPFEPHLHLPVLKFWPKASEWLFKQRIARQRDLWQSLNFIGYHDVKRVAKQCGLQVHFRRSLMYRAFKRLDTDAEFRRRCAGSLIIKVYRLLKLTRLLWLIKHLPPALATPMVFELRHRLAPAADTADKLL